MNVFFSQRKPLAIFGLLVLLFFGPLLLAAVFYAFPQLLPKRTTAHGVLLSPPHIITEFTWFDHNAGQQEPAQWQKKWRIWYLTAQDCAQACQANLVKLQQVQRALGKEQGRVELAVARLAAKPAMHFGGFPPGLAIMQLQTAKIAWLEKMAAVPNSPTLTATSERIYLSDPLGNFMMVYPASISQRFLYNDLKHLLKVSNIG